MELWNAGIKLFIVLFQLSNILMPLCYFAENLGELKLKLTPAAAIKLF